MWFWNVPVQVLPERFFIITYFISSRVKVQCTILENSEKYQEKGHATVILYIVSLLALQWCEVVICFYILSIQTNPADTKSYRKSLKVEDPRYPDPVLKDQGHVFSLSPLQLAPHLARRQGAPSMCYIHRPGFQTRRKGTILTGSRKEDMS